MEKISRQSFLRMGAFSALLPIVSQALGSDVSAWETTTEDEALLLQLVNANDEQLDQILPTIQAGKQQFSRRIGNDFSMIAAGYAHPQSKYFHQHALIDYLHQLVQVMIRFQTADGTVNIGNLESPPDTSFLIELLCPGIEILKHDGSADALAVCEAIKPFMQKSGHALAVGGVHTANHRWVVSVALAQLHHLYPNPQYVQRIEEWLAEGIFIDADGHYAERSIIYSAVENTAYIGIARLLNKPALLEPVRKNLRMMYYYMEPSGQMITNDSRRQDQFLYRDILLYYYHYRYLAILDRDPFFAAVVQFMEQMPNFKQDVLNKGLPFFMETSLLRQSLPAPAKLNTNYEKLFPTSALLHIRRGSTSTTLFGGVDWPLIVASGRSHSPNFFSYRKGKAVMQYMRLSSTFFSMGYFYSDGLEKVGNAYRLRKKLDIPYYQPMAVSKRKKNGDYTLSPSIDDRFWNKMDFANRKVSNVKTMETIVTMTEVNGMVSLHFSIQGLANVPVTIECCFGNDGVLSGTQAAGNNNHFLEQAEATFTNGSDSIRIGPGMLAHRNINNLEGERYSTHFGSLRTEGQRLFITGLTPFNHTLHIS